MTGMSSKAAFAQLQKVLGLTDAELSFEGPDDPAACPAADPDTNFPITGVSTDDERDLEERNGYATKIHPQGIQIRACMTFVLT